MGRKKITKEKKKRSISIVIDEINSEMLYELNLKSKSKFINWLLREHFNFEKNV